MNQPIGQPVVALHVDCIELPDGRFARRTDFQVHRVLHALQVLFKYPAGYFHGLEPML